MCENCNFDTVFLQHNRTPKVQFILFEQPVARPFRKVLNDFLHTCSFLKVMAWKRMKLPGELFSSSNISSNLRCHTKPFATTGSPQGRLCTETKKMRWHLSPSRCWTSKMKKKSMVCEITNRSHGPRSPEISFGFFVYCKFALLES